MPNKRACRFIPGKVYLLGFIEVWGQTLPEINVHGHLFGALESMTKVPIFVYRKVVRSSTSCLEAHASKLFQIAYDGII